MQRQSGDRGIVSQTLDFEGKPIGLEVRWRKQGCDSGAVASLFAIGESDWHAMEGSLGLVHTGGWGCVIECETGGRL
jgi:hypothetical protein